ARPVPAPPTGPEPPPGRRARRARRTRRTRQGRRGGRAPPAPTSTRTTTSWPPTTPSSPGSTRAAVTRAAARRLRVSSSRAERVQPAGQQPVHLVGTLLLHPVPAAVGSGTARHAGSGIYGNLRTALDHVIESDAVDPVRNPYAPGAGQRPPELAGRDREISQFEVVLERVARGRPERSMVLTGLRGVGKTVLLNTFRSMAMQRLWGTGKIEARPEQSIRRPVAAALHMAVRELAPRHRAPDRIKQFLAVLKAFALR